MRAPTRINRRIWRIAWPAILSNISVPMLGLVDTALLGHLDSTRYLGAVAVGASILSFVYWGFGFIRMGTTGLVARAVGARNRARELRIVLQSILLGLVLALSAMALGPVWIGIGLWLMAPEPGLAAIAESYLAIRLYSAPAVLTTYAIVGWFIGRQDTRWPMLFVVATNVLNIALDVVFIVGLDMKSDGAALATLIAEYIGCVLALGALLHKLDFSPLAAVRAELFRLAAYRDLLNSNRYLFVRTVCLLSCFAFFTAMSARLGETVLAANTIMLQLAMLAAYVLDGFAFAAEGIAGTAAGAGKMRQFHAGVRGCARWTMATAALFSALFMSAEVSLYPLFTDHPEVIATLREYHWWLVALPLIAAWCYLMDGVFIGAVRPRPMMATMLISLLFVYLPAWQLSQPLGNHGLWLAFLLFNAARGATLHWCYRRLSASGGWLD